MALKIITPDAEQRMRAAAVEYSTLVRSRATLARHVLSLLAVWRGKRIDKRIADALKGHLRHAMNVTDPVVRYTKTKATPGLLGGDTFKVEATLYWRTAMEVSISVQLPVDYTADKLAAVVAQWTNAQQSADKVDAVLADLPSVVQRYNAAVEAMQAALAPVMNSTGSYVVHPFSDFFQW